MWTDVETAEDLIGFRVHADLLRAVVTDPTLLPTTIGVFGDWGGGKTSIMRMLERDLDPETTADSENKARYEQIACLYINGWLFEGYDDAKSALLSAVLLTLGEHKRFGPKVREKAASLLKSVNWMRVARLGLKEVALPAIAAYASGGASLVPTGLSILGRATKGLLGGDANAAEKDDDAGADDSGAAKEKDAGSDPAGEDDETVDWEALIRKDKKAASPMDVRTFRKRFEQLLEETKINTLVVLIDDLDRCSPERIVDNLEAIKLFLNVPRTAFVIGADPRIVRHAIAYRYRTGVVERDSATPSNAADGGPGEAADAEERLITDYLEKLIQIPYWLPRLSPAEIETYMALLFCRRDLASEKWQACLTASDQQRTANRYGVFGYAAVRSALGGGDVAPASLASGLAFSASAAPLITEGLKGNPRQVKRFLNAFVLRKKLATVAQLTNVQDDVLVKLMILEYARPTEFRQLFEWQAAQQGFPAELRAMEAAYAAVPSAPDSVGAEDVASEAEPAETERAASATGAGHSVNAATHRSTTSKTGRDAPTRETSARAPMAASVQPARSGVPPAAPAALAWSGDFFKRWIAIKPLLGDVDLRDYFWVARDRLATTFSGLSLVAPLVRRTFEELIGENSGLRPRAAAAAAAMGADERAALLTLLSDQVLRRPDQKVGYDAFRALIEHGAVEAASALREAAQQVAPERVPAAVGPDLRSLVSGRSELSSDLQPIIDQWAATNTAVGRSLSRGRARSASSSAAPRT